MEAGAVVCLGPGHTEAEPLAECTNHHLVCVSLPCVVMMQGRFSDDHGEDEGPVLVLGQSVQLSAYIPVKPWEPGSQRCMDLCNGLASASLWDCGFLEGRDQGCLAYQQIPGPCMVPGVPTGSINICGMIKGYCWMAEGSRVMKTGYSVLFLNAIELKCSQNEGIGPGDLSSNTGGVYVDDVTSTSHLLVCTLKWKEMVSPFSEQDPGPRQTWHELGKGSVLAGNTGAHMCSPLRLALSTC